MQTTVDSEQVRAAVRETYGRIATQQPSSGCCGTSGCCGPAAEPTSEALGYSEEERRSAPDGADLGLGCGNPQAIAELKAGERVLIGCSVDGGDANPTTAPKDAEPAAVTISQVSGRAPAGALILLEPVDAPAPLPDGPAVMDQFSKAFVPETLFVRVGQPVTFKNSEDQLHNVAVTRARTGTGIFNVSQNQGDVYTHTFEQAGEYDVNCDVHPGMRAVLIAATTPHAAYADARRTFLIANVPPGAYKLQVVADGRTSERVVDVSGAKMDVGDLTSGR